jgi:hypothetical protein
MFEKTMMLYNFLTHYKRKERPKLYGPVIKCTGTWHKGKLHREDGPAVERTDGVHTCWLYGELLDQKILTYKSTLLLTLYMKANHA